MQLNQYNRKVMTNGGESTKFTAEMNGAAFAIFSDTLYQHKIAALIREICCNAYDSHIEAGCEDKPFYVKLPNRFDPNFMVEDWGMGLDDVGVRTVFASYFKSTKNDSVKQTGGFGIGAKSIFSYSNTFEITAIKDGVVRKYAAFIGEEGIPEVQIFSENETDKPNGVCVKVPVQEKDFEKFKGEASVILSAFKVVPEVVGRDFTLTADNIHQEIEDNGYAKIPRYTESSLYSGNDVYALLNNVFYPIPHNVIHQEVASEKLGLIRDGKAFIIRFEDGELSPAAPREFLSLNDATKEKVALRIKEVVDKSLLVIQEEIDKETHPVKAIQYLQYKVGVNQGMMVFQYDKRKLKYYMGRYVSIPNAQFGYVKKTRSGKRVRKFLGKPTLGKFVNHLRTPGDKYYLFYRPVGAKATPMKTHISKYMNIHQLPDGCDFIVIEEECSDHKLDRIEKLCGVEFEKVDSVTLAEQVKKERKEAKARQTIGEKTDTTIYAKIVNNSGNVLMVRHNDVSDGNYYYVSVEDADLYDMKKIVRPSFFGEEIKYILSNSMNMRKIKENNLKSVKEVVDKYVEDNPEVKDYLVYHQVFDGSGLRGKSMSSNYFLRSSQTKEAKALRELHDDYKSIRTQFHSDVLECCYFRNHLDYEKVEKIRNQINEFCEKFSFLTTNDWNKVIELFDFAVEKGFNKESTKEEVG